MNVLVTGGLGFVGAHVVRALLHANAKVAILDDASSGRPNPCPPGVALYQTDIADTDAIDAIVRDRPPAAIVHCCGLIQVAESVLRPDHYYRVNISRAAAMLDAFRLRGEVPSVIFSSSAAVYGNPARSPVDEDQPVACLSPYGETKLAFERILASYQRAFGQRWVALRYFNAAGGHPSGEPSERHDPETHLIPSAIDAALGRRGPLSIFGADWPTPDGTCVRDYVHVEDLADAHVAAIHFLRDGGAPQPINLGSGRGHSVREVMAAVERAVGRPVPFELAPKREGDPPLLVSDVSRAARVLGWRAKRVDLDEIVRDAYAGRRATMQRERAALLRATA